MDELNQSAIQAAETVPEAEELKGRKKRKARKQRWKAQKKAKRAALKAEYKDAPWLKKLFRLYLRKPIAILLVLAALAFLLQGPAISLLQYVVMEYYKEFKQNPVELEKIYAEAPLDEGGGQRIEAVADYSPDDSWAFYVYMVGSNLEDMDENDLSGVTQALVASAAAENSANTSYKYSAWISDFYQEMLDKGMDFPEALYLPQKPVASSTVVTEDVVVANQRGFASTDIGEITSVELPENVKFVIQPGGAKRWSNSLINPNKTQRFLYSSEGFKEICNLPIQDSASPDTLAEFLTYCKKNYPADHTVLIFWDHGGASFGYGCDSIFNSMLSLADMRQALSEAFEPDRDDPPIELIGFDACLMATVETAHAFEGFTRYLAASEEVEPGDGWDYTTWLSAFAENTGISGADLARLMADSYMDYYIRSNINVGSLTGEMAVQFSVIDVNKGEEAYQAYSGLAAAALKAAVKDQSVLAVLGRAASRSDRFAESSYRVYNTIDLGMFMDGLTDDFPDEAYAVKKAVEDAVLYHRENSYLADSQGITVYMPVQIEGLGGVSYFLEYINSICENDDIRALYYYKLAGCLNDELQSYATEQGYGRAKKLNVSELRKLPETPVTVNGGNFSVPVSDEAAGLMQGYVLECGIYDEENETIRYLGRDNYAYLDGEGNLATDFDAEWVTFGGELLALDIIDDTASNVKYRSDVLYNSKESYLVFTFDKDSEKFTVLGIRDVPTGSSGNAADVCDRVLSELKPGDKITPLYKQDNLLTDESEVVEGKTVKYNSMTELGMKKLPAGYYLLGITAIDPRGDEYYSQVVGMSVSGGKAEMAVNDSFVAYRD